MIEHKLLEIEGQQAPTPDELDTILGEPDFWRDEQEKAREFCEAADKRLQQSGVTIIL